MVKNMTLIERIRKRLSNAIKGIIIGTGLMMVSMGAVNAALISDTNAGALNGVDVGLVDTLVDEGYKLGSPVDESVWVNSVLGGAAVEYTVKAEDVTYFSTNELGTYAFEVQGQPDYFLIKNSQFVALFENLASEDFGVFNVLDLYYDLKLGDLTSLDRDFTISHVTEFDNVSAVPEPGMIGLMGAGLLGMGVVGRRKLK